MTTDAEQPDLHRVMATRKTHCTWKFTATLEKQPGRYGWSYLEFPHDVKELFGKRGEVRVKCLFNGVACDRALMPTRSGIHILSLNAALRKAAGDLRPGDPVEVELWPDPEPRRIVVSEELAESLDFIPEFKRAWEGLTPGRQRDLCNWIASGKAANTRAKRIAEMWRRAEAGEHPFTRKIGKR